MKDKLFLIDGTALFYRDYFAFIRSLVIKSNSMATWPTIIEWRFHHEKAIYFVTTGLGFSIPAL